MGILMRLHDKVIIVTGSTTGIGEAIARRCVAEGARVLVHGRNRERGEQVVAELGTSARLHVDDLSDPPAAKRIVQAAVDAWGRIDAVVNNAANVARSNLESTTPEFFDRMMAINLRAPLLLVQAAHPWLKQSHGAVLNIGSMNAYCGEANLLAYSISKGGLMTMSRNLADALGREQIRVTHFNVGWVLTENEYQVKVKDGLPPDWPEKVPREYAPSGRIMKPEEIAGAAVYWLSDESRPISGSVIELEQYPIIGRNPTKED
jgi:NAD(P)-dependent dehydrogenase (short-subunit alcohol dehydrogenase family)